jgi:hypothetical protein
MPKLTDVILKYQAASDWIRELKRSVTGSLVYRASVKDTVFDIIRCRVQLFQNEIGIDSVRTSFNLLDGTGIADLGMWMKDLESNGHIYHVVHNIRSGAENFRIFKSAAGHVGYAPEEAREEDLVVIFFGVPTPFIIRQLENGRYRFLGPAYVERIMMGEFMKGDYVEETFDLE